MTTNSLSRGRIRLQIFYTDRKRGESKEIEANVPLSDTVRELFQVVLMSVQVTHLRPEELAIVEVRSTGGYSLGTSYTLQSRLEDLRLACDYSLYIEPSPRSSRLTIYGPDSQRTEYDWRRSETTLAMLVDHVIRDFSLQSIERSRVHLFYLNEELDQTTHSDDLLAYLKIADNAVLDVEIIPPIGVRVECSSSSTGEKFVLEAQPKDTLYQLKRQIEGRLGNAVLINVFFYDSTRHPIGTGDATQTLDELGIKRGSKISAKLQVATSRDQLISTLDHPSAQIDVKVSIRRGATVLHTTEVPVTETVGYLTRRIEHLLRDQPSARFEIFSKTMTIDRNDSRRCLADLGLKAGDQMTVSVLDDHRSTRTSPSASEPVGLYNLGNTCYMNSALQCLAHLPALKQFFLDGLAQSESPTDTTSEPEWNTFHDIGAVTGVFAHLVSNLWLGKRSYYSRSFDPNLVKETISLRAPRFATWDQQDAQEFLTYFLDEIHREITEKNNHDSNTIIKQLFFAQIQSTITCLSCGHSQTTSNPISLLSLPLSWQPRQFLVQYINKYGERKSETVTVSSRGRVKDLVNAFTKLSSWYSFYKLMPMAEDGPLDEELPLSRLLTPEVTLVEQDAFSRSSYRTDSAERLTLEECLAEFFVEEELESSLRCDGKACERQRQMTKQFRFESLPSVLIIQLKRFSHENGFRQKVNTFVQYPLEALDLSAFVSSPSAQSCLYDLVAVSNHIGSIYGGHYTAFARRDGGWFEFNDSLVTKVYSTGDLISPNAYLLFYLKRT